MIIVIISHHFCKILIYFICFGGLFIATKSPSSWSRKTTLAGKPWHRNAALSQLLANRDCLWNFAPRCRDEFSVDLTGFHRGLLRWGPVYFGVAAGSWCTCLKHFHDAVLLGIAVCIIGIEFIKIFQKFVPAVCFTICCVDEWWKLRR